MQAFAAADQAEPLKSLRFLVLDDQLSDVELLRQAFAKQGVFHLHHISDGRQAHAFLDSTSSSIYDAIILDAKVAGILVIDKP